MKKILILLLIISMGVFTSMVVWGNEGNKKIEIGGALYLYRDLYRIIDARLEVGGNDTALKKYETYQHLYTWTEDRFTNTQNTMYFQLSEIFDMGARVYKDELKNNIQKIHIGTSTQGRDMYGYFRGVPENGYKLIVSNIHGGYEYGTYETANMLIGELENNNAQGWFIIPTLNPDGLQEYFERGTELNAYLSSRANSRGVDLNRNFCSKNFVLTEFEKYGQSLLTGIEGCESEKETKVFVELAENFYFTHIISLHSTGGIFYVPDGSLRDWEVVVFAKELLSILADYDFYPDFSSQESRSESVIKYEMDEGGAGIFTGMMENYMYEKYEIPVVLIELSEHGVVEDDLKDIFHLDI